MFAINPEPQPYALWADVSLLAIAFVWGATFPMVKTAIENIPPMEFLALRFAIASLVIGVFTLFQIRQFKIGTFLAGFLAGLLLLTGYAFQTYGLTLTSASNAAFITGLSVILVPALSVLFLRERLDFRTTLGVLFATLGLFLLSGGSFTQLNHGDVLELGCALSFGLQIIVVSRLAKNISSIHFTFVQMLTVALGATFFSPSLRNSNLVHSQPIPWFAILFTAVFASSAALLLQAICQKRTSATRTALAFATEPLWGAIFARFLLSEHLSMLAYSGGALLIAGMIIVEISPGFWRRIAKVFR